MELSAAVTASAFVKNDISRRLGKSMEGVTVVANKQICMKNKRLDARNDREMRCRRCPVSWFSTAMSEKLTK